MKLLSHACNYFQNVNQIRVNAATCGISENNPFHWMSADISQVAAVAEHPMAPYYTNLPYVLNLSNSIIGVSILALPFCFRECGIVLGLLLLLLNAWFTQKTCHLLMKTAFMSKKRSYEYTALHVFGRSGKLLVEISIIGMLLGTCIAFYVIIGDLGPAIIAKITGLENTWVLRSMVMSLLAIFVALPLGMMESLEHLSNYSAISLTFYSVFLLQVISAAFPNLWSGVWLAKVIFWKPEGIFKCLPIFSLSFSCHTQLFLIYEALPDASIGRMRAIIKNAVSLCSVLYSCIGCFGYVAFCDEEISGDILMSFRPTFFSDVVKLGFVMSTVISFPLVIYPCRASIYSLLFAREEKTLHDNFGGVVYIPTLHFRLITLAIIGFTLIVGILVPDVEFVLAITGATTGSLICYIIPAGMFITIMSMSRGKGKLLAQVILFVGITILLASSYLTLFPSHDGLPAHKQQSVVKVGRPIAHDELGAAAAERQKPKSLHPHKDKILNMEGEIHQGQEDEAFSKARTTPANVLLHDRRNRKAIEPENGENEAEVRQEPPNPRAPLDFLQNVDHLNGDLVKSLEMSKNENGLRNGGAQVFKPNESNRWGNTVIVGVMTVNDERGAGQTGPSVPASSNSSVAVKQRGESLDDSPQASLLGIAQSQKLPNDSNIQISLLETAKFKTNASAEVDLDRSQQLHEGQQVQQQVQQQLQHVQQEQHHVQQLQQHVQQKQQHVQQHVQPEQQPVQQQQQHVQQEQQLVQLEQQHVQQEQQKLHQQKHLQEEQQVRLLDEHGKLGQQTNHVNETFNGDEGLTMNQTSSLQLNRFDVELNAKLETNNEARRILVELKKQQEEQRKLLDEQRQIIEDLKQHHLNIHENGQKSTSILKSGNNEQKLQALDNASNSSSAFKLSEQKDIIQQLNIKPSASEHTEKEAEATKNQSSSTANFKNIRLLEHSKQEQTAKEDERRDPIHIEHKTTRLHTNKPSKHLSQL